MPISNTLKSKLVETLKEEVKGIKLEEAEVIVAGGGGIGALKGSRCSGVL
jgi:electron transfer flavoprotein alpha subunit